MDIRLTTNPAIRAALLKNQTSAQTTKAQESGASSYRSTDTFELSAEAIAVRTSEASKEAESSTSTFYNQWLAERKLGVLRKEDGSPDNRETTFFWKADGDRAYNNYLLAQGKSTKVYFSEMEIASCQIVRDQISKSVRDLLQKNNITIPEGQSFTLSVDSNNFIHAVGLDDPELTYAVERAINVGNNGCFLKQHISDCREISRLYGFEMPSMEESLGKSKESLFLMVQDLAGYDIRELERKDGNIYTPDGQNLWDVLKKNAANYKTPDGVISIDISQYWLLYSHIAKFGWDSVPDPVYELTYMDGGLYDIGTKYGYGPGQTDWQEWAQAHAETLSNNAFANIDRLMAGTAARTASQNQAASTPARTSRVAESQEVPEETEKPGDSEVLEEPEKPDPETWTGPWTLPLWGKREPLVLSEETLWLENGKLLQPISNKDRQKFGYRR